jgi:hypothetical protein
MNCRTANLRLSVGSNIRSYSGCAGLYHGAPNSPTLDKSACAYPFSSTKYYC